MRTARNTGGAGITISANDAWHGIPRGEIAWQPSVVDERCLGCGLCVTSCGRGVYGFDYERNKPVVLAPERCMVGCTTCATLCLQDAVEFPSRGSIRGLIRKAKLLRQAKDMLRANPEKYDIQAAPATGSARGE